MKVVIRVSPHHYGICDEVVLLYGKYKNVEITKDSEGYWWYCSVGELPKYGYSMRCLPQIDPEDYIRLKDRQFRQNDIPRHDESLVKAFEDYKSNSVNLYSSDFKIVEIPDYTDYGIGKDETSEFVYDKRRVWK